jgi:hypothetical protein
VRAVSEVGAIKDDLASWKALNRQGRKESLGMRKNSQGNFDVLVLNLDQIGRPCSASNIEVY